jgi:hypothetical protein
MAIPAQQIGWSQKSKLLWNISKQLERLTGVTASDGSPYTKATNTTITNWTFTPGDIFVFPPSADGYTLYTGGWTNYDDGQTTDEIPFAGIFNDTTIAFSNFILSTNGYFFGSSELENSENIYGNQDDLYLTPGAPLLDGDIQNFWYKNTIISGCKWKTSILVYCGRCCGVPQQQTPYSYVLNIYKDSTYQYIETVCKANFEYICGPNSNAVPASNLTQVWQSDLLGSSWNYLGFGSIDGGIPSTTTTTTTIPSYSYFSNYSTISGPSACYQAQDQFTVYTPDAIDVAVPVYTDSGLTIPASDGYYSFSGTIYSVVGNSVNSIAACPSTSAYSYVISQTDLNAATGNTDTNLNGKVYTITADDGSGNPSSRTFTASGSYNHWMCSADPIIPTFGYYAADVFVTGTLVSTQTNIGPC